MNIANRRALVTNMQKIKEMKRRKGYHASLAGENPREKATKERSHSPLDGEWTARERPKPEINSAATTKQIDKYHFNPINPTSIVDLMDKDFLKILTQSGT